MKTTSGLLITTAIISTLVSAGLASARAQDQGQDQEIEEIVVTGSYIRRPRQAESAVPFSVLVTEDLNEMGAKTIADVTQTLTINTGAQNNPDAFTQNLSTGTSNINLRG